ncbi:HAD family hydrolase [Paenibacillus thermoaerophilus]|uniref:HAD family hydrolase n=1 Tax=Paenibacillus thermoaerophilus TaxID=1215385 RepID=A0ABW2V3Y8_9BACL|nr:HAD family hydrolase [Paenibacillus thermoaerophilus]TMV13909.1 HAD family hydrolase [Paenibacillus thermoaerophilus]
MHKAILFDLDDTLVYFDEYWEDSVREALRLHPLTREFDMRELYEAYREKDLAYEQLYLRREITLDQFRHRRLIDVLGERGRRIGTEEAEDFERLYKRISKTKINPSEEVTRLIERLGRSYTLAIMTNGEEDWQKDKLEAVGLLDVFADELLFISERIGYEKPDPAIYRHAIGVLGLRPQDILFVGDSWNNDVAGPIRAGMDAVWLNRKGLPVPEGEVRPLAVIRRLTELERVLPVL